MQVSHAAEIGSAVPTHVGECTDGIELRFADQLYGRFDRVQQTLWMRWHPAPRPCFNPYLLAQMRRFAHWLRMTEGRVGTGAEDTVKHLVICSDIPGVFNLGGDLDAFQSMISARDRDGLLAYGTACVDVLYSNYCAYELPIITISLVQGEALGGGFEAALSSDVVIAERRARLGFPEILFNLFPGMGAYSFVGRRVPSQAVATEVISSGVIYDADKSLDLGLIDHVADDEQGEHLVKELVSSQGAAHLVVLQTRRRIAALTRAELREVVEIWVDAAMRLTERDLRFMQMLVKRQSKLSRPAVGNDRDQH